MTRKDTYNIGLLHGWKSCPPRVYIASDLQRAYNKGYARGVNRRASHQFRLLDRVRVGLLD